MYSNYEGRTIYANKNELNLNTLISAEFAVRQNPLLMEHSLLLN